MDRIEGFFLKINNKTVWLNLTNNFNALIDAENRHVDFSLTDENSFVEPELASVTTLYGANGCGKTHTLLSLANATYRERGVRPGILFSKDGNVLLFRGEVLQHWKTNFETTSAPPEMQAVFYTSSPFDKHARSVFSAYENVIDVSPEYESGMQYEIKNLVNALMSIKEKIPRLKKLKIKNELPRPSVKVTAENLAMVLTSRYRTPGHFKRQDIINILYRHLREGDTFHKRAMAFDAKIIIHFNKKLDNYSVEAFYDWINLLYSGRSEGYPLSNWLRETAKNLSGGYSGNDMIEITHLLKTKDSRYNNFHTITQLATVLHELNDRGLALLQFMSELGLYRLLPDKMSSGETALLYFTAALSSAMEQLKVKEKTPILLLIDEGEIFLHPDWQKRYIQQLIELISHFPELAKRIHLIITTHSLIVASDSPPNSLFDVNSGSKMNAFGLSPSAVMEDIYKSGEFSGDYTAGLLKKVVDYFDQTLQEKSSVHAVTRHDVIQIINALADERLKQVLRHRLLDKTV